MRATVAAALLATMLVPTYARAQAGPTVEFLNPSDYTTTVELSDKTDQNDAIHLVAWVGNVPPNPLVEFEISSTTTGTTTIDADRAGTDTWEAFFSPGGLPDGQYTLRAILYRDFTGVGTGTEVDTTEKVVALNSNEIPPPPPQDTVEITYPENGGSFGIHKPKGKRSNGIIEAIASDDTDRGQIRVLYTTSAPGTDPDWVLCGSGRVVDGLARARCTLAEGTEGAQVRAIAAVANETPWPADPSAVADGTGDAHRVLPYNQIPRFVEINPDAVSTEPSTSNSPTCPQFVATVFDELARPVADANIDVHVTGPDDQIRYGWVNMETDPFQAPDSNHVSNPRPSVDCSDGTNERSQGDHNIPGADDPQHIESVEGTTTAGTFTFALRSTTRGGSRIIGWADDNDDDLQQVAEASGGARVGWGEPPPASERQLFIDPSSTTATVGDCLRVEAIVRLDGSADPGINVDVHASGPDETISFCTPPGETAGRPPDQGSHVGDADDSDTRHVEGETDAAGRFVFGVTAANQGTTSLDVWIDSNLDDLQDIGETARRADVSWTLSGDRDISISSNRSRVRRGRAVRISGAIDGTSATCEGGQVVRLQAKRMRGGRFRTIMSTTTEADGDYSFRVVVRKSKRYRAVAPEAGACEKARSRTITVRRR